MVGVSERRLVRRAGVLLVVTIMTTAVMLKTELVIASETDVLKGLVTALAVFFFFFLNL